MPKKSFAVLNTRPQHQSKKLTQLIEEAGGNVFQLPIIEIQPVLFQPPKTDDFDTVIFLSANAVHYFFKQNDFLFSKSKIIAIGSATQQALIDKGFYHTLCPDHFSSEGLLKMPLLQKIKNQKIMIISGKNPKPLLSITLTERGAQVKNIFCYQRKPVLYNMEIIFPDFLKNNIDCVISTSTEGLNALLNLFQKTEHRQWLLSKTVCVISDEMKKIAVDAGFKLIVQANNATDEAIFEKIPR